LYEPIRIVCLVRVTAMAFGPTSVGGLVDHDGRLVAADPRLLALQLSAGGDAHGVIAVPQLASLVRLSRTLGIIISRGIIAAEGELDLDLWVRAEPEGDQVRLAIVGWEERPKASIAPEIAAERSALLSELGSDGTWTTDASLRLTTVDRKLASLLPIDWKGERIFRLLDFVTGEGTDLKIYDAILDGQPFSGQVARILDRDDAEISLSGKPQRVSTGSLSGYAGTFRWTRIPPELTEPETSQGDDQPFITQLDGALRRPLARIIANADDIAEQFEGPLKPEYLGYAIDIAAAGRHLLGLVDDLGDLQAVERSDFAVDADVLDIADVARRAASLLGVRAADSQVQIQAPAKDEVIMARADFRRALQIMVNLVGNAVRYSPQGSMIWIRAEQEGDMASLTVADQGKGISLENQSLIFEKFGRVDPSEPGGSGLGLYISQRLARAMGGDLTVESAPGQGARFVFTLPAAAAALPD
jgi:signal transduction histidine kinase